MNKRINKIFIELFPSLNEKLDENWGPNEIDNWDSLNHLNLVLALEKEFEITLEFDEVLSLEKISDVYELINNKV